MTDDFSDVRNHVVAVLPPLSPGSARAARVRALCAARLERDRSRRLDAIARFGRNVLAPVIAAALLAVYAVDLLSIALLTAS
jgi:hypothetical protein